MGEAGWELKHALIMLKKDKLKKYLQENEVVSLILCEVLLKNPTGMVGFMSAQQDAAYR